MSDTVYEELVAAGAPRLDVASGEFYRIKAQYLMGNYYSHSITIRRKTWLWFSHEVPGSTTTVDVEDYVERFNKSPGEEGYLRMVDLFAWACKRSVDHARENLERRRALDRSNRFAGDHP